MEMHKLRERLTVLPRLQLGDDNLASPGQVYSSEILSLGAIVAFSSIFIRQMRLHPVGMIFFSFTIVRSINREQSISWA